MYIEKIAKIKENRQDGAIFGGYLFSFNHKGHCTVYQTDALDCVGGGEAEAYAEFVLDQAEEFTPHSNAVMFGNEYYSDRDEFPLLYTNVYNNYAKEEDKKTGLCLVYRLQKNGEGFVTTLVQMIEIGFSGDENYWKSPGEEGDVRPYGNFTIDTEKGIYYGFTMRDASHKTRCFAFRLPKAKEGVLRDGYQVPKVVLAVSDIKDYFDFDYQHYVQGACCFNGKIYSLEGFTDSEQNPPALRIVDPMAKTCEHFKLLEDYGMNIEPEMIDFHQGICYYGDHHGNIYKITF